jgi:hypothetical protein
MNRLGYSIAHRRITRKELQGKDIVFTNVRHPYSWYKSLYQYWEKRLREGNDPYNPVVELATLKWEDFLEVILHKENFLRYFKREIGDKKSDPSILCVFDLHCGYMKCPLDVGFFSYLVLCLIFDEKVYDLSVADIIHNKKSLLLVPNVLKQETLQENFRALLHKHGITLNNIKGFKDVINQSVDSVKVSEEDKKKIYAQDRLLFEIFDYEA